MVARFFRCFRRGGSRTARLWFSQGRGFLWKIRRNTGGVFENLSHRIFDAFTALSHRAAEKRRQPLSEVLEDSNAHGHINPLSETLEDSNAHGHINPLSEALEDSSHHVSIDQ